MIGLTQSAILIYSPVWVDEFAPPGKATQWISLLQANVAIGIMLGYVVGGVFTETFGPWYWRLAILIQACILACFIPVYICVSGAPSLAAHISQQAPEPVAVGWSQAGT